MAQENATTANQLVCKVEHSEPWRMLGETYAFRCQTLTLAAAAIAAFLAIRASRAIERRKAAAAAVFAGRRDETLAKAIRRIAVPHDSEKNMAALARKDNIDSDDSKDIRYALNHYEHVSVAIAHDIYDGHQAVHSSQGLQSAHRKWSVVRAIFAPSETNSHTRLSMPPAVRHPPVRERPGRRRTHLQIHHPHSLRAGHRPKSKAPRKPLTRYR